jgi:SAM-dependent methyltransferase
MSRKDEWIMTISRDTVESIAASIREHSNDGTPEHELDGRTQAIRSADPDRREELERFIDRLGILTDEERWGLDDAMDNVQMASKLWLIDELIALRDLATSPMVILGAWYGILPLLINWRVERPPEQMLCIDIDASVLSAGERLIGPLYNNIEYRLADAMTWNYHQFAKNPDSIVVNTICEHLPFFAEWWDRVPQGQFVVLQSNNYFLCPDHVNAVESINEMKKQAPMSEVLFEGALPLLKWKRFMLIGLK